MVLTQHHIRGGVVQETTDKKQDAFLVRTHDTHHLLLYGVFCLQNIRPDKRQESKLGSLINDINYQKTIL
jgi:hypothetical protein